MILSLLLQVSDEAKKAGDGKGDEVIGEKVKSGIKTHLEKLHEHTENLKKELVEEEAEQKKHITSDDIHDGFDSKVCSPWLTHITIMIYGDSIVHTSQTGTTTHQERKTRRSQIQNHNEDHRVRNSQPQSLLIVLIRTRPSRLRRRRQRPTRIDTRPRRILQAPLTRIPSLLGVHPTTSGCNRPWSIGRVARGCV